MASIIKGKIKILPSGLSSVIFSHICIGKPLGGDKRVGCEAPFPDFECGGKRVMSGSIHSDPSDPSDPLAVVPNFGKSPQASQLPVGYGSLGGKPKASWKSLRNARERMAATEMHYGIGKVGLLTVTLPSISPESYEALARYSSYAMDRLNREFNRYFGSRNHSRVAVWEYQKRGALHCHIMLASDCMDAINEDEFVGKFSSVWYRILAAIGKKTGAKMFVSSKGKDRSLSELLSIKNKKNECVFANFQKVRKSVVAYLSRYLSSEKDGKKSKAKNALRERFYPIATWIQWNREATKHYEKYCDEFDLGEYEPDKKPLIISKLGHLKNELLKHIKLAKDTEIKHPQNPYNEGLYFLPKEKEDKEKAAELLCSFMAKISCFASESIIEKYAAKSENLTPKTSLPQYPSLDIELSIRDFEAKKRMNAAGISRKFWQDAAFPVLNLLQLADKCLSILESQKAKKYEQLRLDYGLES